MEIYVHVLPLIALICGVAILIMPRFLSFIVTFFLILYGILGLVGQGG